MRGSVKAPAEVHLSQRDLLQTPQLRPERVRRVGSALSPDSVQFGRIGDVAIGGPNRVYVADIIADSVLVVDSLGTIRNRIGGEGSGPGEFRGRLFLGVGTADTLRVYDARLRRVTVFGPGGGLVRTYQPTIGPNYGQIPEFDFDARGDLYQLGYGPFLGSLRDALDGRRKGLARGENSLQRWDRQTDRWTELKSVPSREVYFTGSGLRDAPFGRRPLWSARPAGGLWYADSDAFVLHKLGADGVKRCTVIVDWPSDPVTTTMRDSFYSAEGVDPDDPNRVRRIRASRSEISVPDELPELRRLTVTRDGDVWILTEKEVRQENDRETVTWHVLSSEGEPRARVVLPRRLRPFAETGDRVWGVERAALDVDRLALYRIPAEGDSGR